MPHPVSVLDDDAPLASGRIADPRLRRHPESSGTVRQIRITKTVIDSTESNLSAAGSSPEPESPKPSRFSLMIPSKRTELKIAEKAKRTFEDWNQTAQIKPSPFPRLPPLPPSDLSKDRTSGEGSTRDVSSRKSSSHRKDYQGRKSYDSSTRNRSSDRLSFDRLSPDKSNDLSFSRGPAEAAKRRSDSTPTLASSSSKWKVISEVSVL